MTKVGYCLDQSMHWKGDSPRDDWDLLWAESTEWRKGYTPVSSDSDWGKIISLRSWFCGYDSSIDWLRQRTLKYSRSTKWLILLQWFNCWDDQKVRNAHRRKPARCIGRQTCVNCWKFDSEKIWLTICLQLLIHRVYLRVTANLLHGNAWLGGDRLGTA